LKILATSWLAKSLKIVEPFFLTTLKIEVPSTPKTSH
jgi:hypothetical protein